MENSKKIKQLLQHIAALQSRQNAFQREISQLRVEIRKLSTEEGTPDIAEERERIVATDYLEEERKEFRENRPSYIQKQRPPKARRRKPKKEWKLKEGIEAFIGTNLINKIGILITIIGVGIGTKYAIDNELINPLTRIVLSYVFGTGLLLMGLRLKAKYKNYSAVLLSGALAILYFTTYIGYDFYNLFPQMVAFALMFVFTAFSVVAALNYDQQVIAAIGLVGAYGIPFLLSDGSGRVQVLFTYMAIVNVGILLISFYKYWKHVSYLAFGFTWLIVISWFNRQYDVEAHFSLSIAFTSIFFLIFYGAFVSYKIIKKEVFLKEDIILILSNSFISYGLGYATLNSLEATQAYLGLYTAANAAAHFIFSAVVFKQKLADKNLFFLTAGLVLVFITIAVPVQLDGNWVTLIWGGEALILFWIGRSQKINMYERLAYPLIVLGFFSMLHDWSVVYDQQFYYALYGDTEVSKITAFWNINFLTALLLSFALGMILRLFYSMESQDYKLKSIALIGYGLSLVFLITLFYTFYFEIDLYWQGLYSESLIATLQKGFETEIRDYDLREFGAIWQFNYALLFFTGIALFNRYKINNEVLAKISSLANVVIITFSLLVGLFICSQLREHYIEQYNAKYYVVGSGHLLIRYTLVVFILITLISTWLQQTGFTYLKENKMGLLLFTYFTALFLASSELLHWMDLADYAQSYKLGLSILWGVFSLLMVVLGIRNKQKPVRIAGIALFGVTLVKLFFYDIANLSTIAKVIVFISLGILLLIISFLYNKYKDVITEN